MGNVIIHRLYNVALIVCLIHLTLGDQPKIIIIGAGPAGIAAASKLYEHGFRNLTILEAESRIGGRVYTTWFDESWVDLGGQSVHGETGNIVFQIASPLGLLEVPDGNGGLDFNIHDSKGSQLPVDIADDLLELYLNVSAIAEKALEGNNGSMGDFFAPEFSRELLKYQTFNETVVKGLIKMFEGLTISTDSADNWNNISAKNFVGYADCPGSEIVNWKDRGYGTILDILMKKYPNPEEELPIMNNTLLNSEVVNVNYNATDKKVLIETSNGQKYTADHVIVTPSLGVLKEQYETLFTPQLPESKVKTIKGLSMGSAAKIYFAFKEPWWPANRSLVLLWDETDRREYENDPSKKWLLDLISFTVVPHRPRLLRAWINGAGARYMETLPESQAFDEAFALLDKFFGKSYNITKPTGHLRTNWNTNKHFRGAYSFRSMESERADVWANELAAPLLLDGKPIVMFAGEATNSQHWSTVHGAIDSGFREADRLIELYNTKNLSK
nr:spermine oxidase-like [Neodiprion pinetum]